jgi:hypothetical protein
VVISAEVYRTAVADMSHDGQWLIEQAGHLGFDIPEPSRREDRRDLVFED